MARTGAGVAEGRDRREAGRRVTVIESGDHVIVFVTDKQEIPEIERLFSRKRSLLQALRS